MWTFAVTLLLVGLYPGSLLMPGVLGFLVQLFAAIFGTIVGDCVDTYPRRKGGGEFKVRNMWLIKIEASCLWTSKSRH